MNLIEVVEKEIQPVKRNLNFEIGDTVKVHYKIIEGERERVQIFEGIVIAINNKGLNKTFTVRKISFDVGVERLFPLFSPRIIKIEVVRKGKKRRAKLYFLRERRGKSAKLKERRFNKEEIQDSEILEELVEPESIETSQKASEVEVSSAQTSEVGTEAPQSEEQITASSPEENQEEGAQEEALVSEAQEQVAPSEADGESSGKEA